MDANRSVHGPARMPSQGKRKEPMFSIVSILSRQLRMSGMWRYGLAALVTSAALAALIPTAAQARTNGAASRLTDPAQIETLAADAYKWSLASEYVYRFENYNNLVVAPVNTWGGGQSA